MMAAAGEALLELSSVSKAFGGIRALSGVSMHVGKNRIVGVIGPNGAGKTTLFNVITGAYRAGTGNIVFNGQAITQWPSYQIVRAGVARTFQNIRLFAGMTVWEHLLVAQPYHGAWPRRFLPVKWADPVAWRHAEEALDFFGLQVYHGAIARSLPYGIQRKVEMARALTVGPKLLLLDEPVAGMNHDEAEDVRNLLLRLHARGLSILLIEHDMPFVMNLCQDLYCLDFGALIAEGTPAQIRANPLVLDAYLGSEATC